MAIEQVMERDCRARSGLALGGIGAGWFELRADGVFCNWNIFNNAPAGTGEPLSLPEDSMLFFVIRYQERGRRPQMKILQVDGGYEVATIPSHYYTYPWLTGVDRIEYRAAFPFITMRFSDAEMPLEVTLEAFSPFIPHDVKNSALPAALFNFSITSTAAAPVDVMLMASMRNGVGYDVPDRFFRTKVGRGRGYRLFEHSCGDMDPAHSSTGTQALASLAADSTYYVGWEHRHPYYEHVIRNRDLPNFDDTAGRNIKDPKTGKVTIRTRLFSSIAVSRVLKKNQALDHTFVATWHFPNLYNKGRTHVEGHYYANFFDSAAGVARYVMRKRADLTDKTWAFHDDFYDSSLDTWVLDQVSSHLNTFRTSTWLTAEMNFGVQEGITPARSYGPLATTDVSLYGSVATAALFPELDRRMMQAHRRLQSAKGVIRHGIGNDFSTYDRDEGVTGRLDLPSQYVIMALRAFFWSGDRRYLQEMWPSVKAALEYVLAYRDQNGDSLPDMCGSMCTYDNFPMYGAASYVSSCWLAALAAAVRAAGATKDPEAAERYSAVLDKAKAAFEQKLWNGRYYRLYNDVGGERGDLDEGCLTDQIIGQWANHLSGLGDLFPKGRVRKALRSVLKMSYDPHYGLLNCRWPDDEWLHDIDKNCWSDQANTCWTGVELAFASFLLYEGMWRRGIEIIRNVDRRYRKAGMYWDHQEFGGHYFRPMSAWAIVNAALGLTINDCCYGFAPKVPADDLKLFFAFGGGTAHYVRDLSGVGEKHAVEVGSGTFRCKELTLALVREDLRRATVRAGGRALPAASYEATFDGSSCRLAFSKGVAVKAGAALRVALR